jgi:hypothetical protein
LVCNLDPQPMEMQVCGSHTLEDVVQLLLAHSPTFKCTTTPAPYLQEKLRRTHARTRTHGTRVRTRIVREATIYLQREDGEWGQLEPGAPLYIHGLRRYAAPALTSASSS